MVFPGSYTPPLLPSPATASHRPSWILLDQDAYIAGRGNATTAAATSRDGTTIEVSFWVADPPAVSYLCVRCRDANGYRHRGEFASLIRSLSKSKDTDFEFEPCVVGAEGRFVVIRVRLLFGSDEYFMYRGDPESPTLERIPLPGGYRLPLIKECGIVPRGDGGHYLLAVHGMASFETPVKYHLHIYSSEDQTWSTKPLPDSCPGGCIIAQKLITLGEGVLGWVDFWDGVLVCDLFREPVSAYFIPFPQPLPENREMLKEFHRGNPAFRVRDVTVSNGVIKFVEMEHRWIVTTIVPEKPSDPSDKSFLYDSDLIMAWKRENMDDKPKQVRKRDGWRVVTWTRTISSDCWRKEWIVDVDDISVDDTMFSSMMSELGVEHDECLKFRNLYSTIPTLSTDGDDTLYLKTVVKPNDEKGLVVAVDLGEKTLKAFCAYNFDRHDPVRYAYCPCSLSRHLDMTSDSCQITQEKNSKDPLEVQQSEAEEAQDALQAQTELQDVSRGSHTKNNQKLCDQSGVLHTSTSCPPHPPQPNTNHPQGIDNHPSTHEPLHAELRQPAILPSGPLPRHTDVHRPGILPTPAADQRSEASGQWPPRSGGSAPAPAWTYSKRRRGAE